MPFNSKRGSHIEKPIFTLEVNSEWVVDMLWLDMGRIRTKTPRVNVPFTIEGKLINIMHPEVIPKVVRNKVIRMLKLDGEKPI